MAISRATKEQQVAELMTNFEKSQLTLLVDYKGLTVADMQALRSDLKAQASSLRVVKNSLIKLAVSQYKPFTDVDKAAFDGPMALAFGFGDEITVAQVVARFAKTHPALEIKGGISTEGVMLAVDQIQQLANLPSKQQLLGQLVGTLAAPITGFARILQGSINNLVYVINAIYEARSG